MKTPATQPRVGRSAREIDKKPAYRIPISLPENIRQKLAADAKKTYRSLNQMVVMILAKHYGLLDSDLKPAPTDDAHAGFGFAASPDL